MYCLIDFTEWLVDEDTPYGSGASEKNWLVNLITKEKGIFKFPKMMFNGEVTGEYWAEKLASEIAKVIGIETAKVDIGLYKNRIGSMSYMLLNDDEELIEGIHYITNLYPNYDGDKFEDQSENCIYSIQMIMESFRENINLKEDFLKIPIFDCLIGNSDRHHNNWAVIKNINSNALKISPLYDNGSALCCYINPNTIMDFMGDSLKFESLIYGKSKSLIGWMDQKRPRHFELIKNIRESYFCETKNLVEDIRVNLTDEVINCLINNFDDKIINPAMKVLVSKFVIARRDKIIEIYNK